MFYTFFNQLIFSKQMANGAIGPCGVTARRIAARGLNPEPGAVPTHHPIPTVTPA
jgi:hypothetical protein